MKKTILNQHICNLPSKNSKKIFKKSFLAISILLANSMVYADCTGDMSGLHASNGSECEFNNTTMPDWQGEINANDITPPISASGYGTSMTVNPPSINSSNSKLSITNLYGDVDSILVENGANAKFLSKTLIESLGGTSIIARDNAKIQFDKNLNITIYEGDKSDPIFGINIGTDSQLNIKGDLSIEAEELHSGSLISSSGIVNLNTATLVSEGSGAGISIGESGNNSSNALIYSESLVDIKTQGNELTDAAILGKYKGTIDLESANIKTKGGAGIYLSDANVNIRHNLDIATKSDKAYGIYITDGSGDFSAGSGQITTSGDEAHGLFETKHLSNINRYLNLDVTTNGKNADAVHLVSNNDINFTTNSAITTNGEGSKGIVAQAGLDSKVNIVLENAASISSNSHSIYVTDAKESLVSLGQASKIESSNGNGIDLSNIQKTDIRLNKDASISTSDHSINITNANESLISLGQGSNIKSSNGKGINLSDIQNVNIISEDASILSDGNAINIANANESLISLGQASKIESQNGSGINLSDLQNAKVRLEETSILSKDHAINIANGNESIISLGQGSNIKSSNGKGINLSDIQNVNIISEEASILSNDNAINISNANESIISLGQASKIESSNGNGINLSDIQNAKVRLEQASILSNGNAINISNANTNTNESIVSLGQASKIESKNGSGINLSDIQNAKIILEQASISSKDHAINITSANESIVSLGQGSEIKSKNGSGINLSDIQNAKIILEQASISSKDHAINIANGNESIISLGQGSKIESSDGSGINLSDLQSAKIILEQASILSNGNVINIANANESIVSLGEGSKLESRNGNGINLSNLQNANIMLQDASILSKDHAINIANANESLISLGEGSKLESRNGNGINLSNLQKVNMKIEKDASILTSGHSISIADTKESIVLLDEGSKLESQNGNGIDLSNLKEGSQSTVYNNGDITVTDGHYAILGGSANDNVKLLGGKVTGDINLGDGNNSFEFSGGTLKGKVLFGMGNAHAILKDKADISEMSRIEGGEGTNSLELSNIKLTGYTADVDNLDKGVNLNNWDNIFLSGNTVFTQSGDLFSSNEANILTRDVGLFNTNKIGTLTISSTATWNMGDNVTSLNIAGNVINSGILNVGDAGQTGRVLSIGGDYEGKGGTVVLNNLASGDEVSTDLIKIAGDAKGVTNLIVHNVGGLGDQTKGDGVEIVQVGGVSDSNAFILNGAVTAGNYEYLLNKGDKSGTNQNWYLRSYKDNNNKVLYNPALGTYLSNQTVAVQMFRQTFFDRLGSLSSSSMSDASEQFYWMINRINHNYYKSIHDKLNNHINSYSVQFGGDINVWALDNDDYFHLGIMGGYGDSRSRSVSNQTKTRTDGEVRGYTVGVYGTYFSNKYTDLGFYVDMMSRMGWYRNDITGHSQVATKNYHSTVWSNSIELGYTLPLITGEEYQLIAIPQGQFTYNLYNAHNQNDKNKLKVSNNDADGLDIRLGSRFIVKGISIVEPFVEVNWLSTTAKNQLDFNGATFKDGFAKNRFETKLGLQNSYNENWKILMQIVGQYGKNNFHSYEGQLNVDYNF